jgi:hypothetical protein
MDVPGGAHSRLAVRKNGVKTFACRTMRRTLRMRLPEFVEN